MTRFALALALAAATQASAGNPKFVKLNAVDPATGSLMTYQTLEYRIQQRIRNVTVTRNGRTKTEQVPYTVRVPVTVSEAVGLKSHNVIDRTGKPIDRRAVFNRLKNGSTVLLADTPKVSRQILNLLSDRAVVLVPKKAPVPPPAGPQPANP